MLKFTRIIAHWNMYTNHKGQMKYALNSKLGLRSVERNYGPFIHDLSELSTSRQGLFLHVRL